MAEMDTDAAPILKLMMNGFSAPLDPNAKQVLAAWATKVAMMLTFAAEDYPPIHEDHLQWLYREKTPPPGVHVWLAAYAGGLTGLTDVKHLTFTDDENVDIRTGADAIPLSGNLVSLVLGLLVVQVWIWAHPLHEAVPIPFHDIRANFAHRIWPAGIVDLVWPPAAILDNDRFYDLAMTDSEMVKVCFSVNPV